MTIILCSSGCSRLKKCVVCGCCFLCKADLWAKKGPCYYCGAKQKHENIKEEESQDVFLKWLEAALFIVHLCALETSLILALCCVLLQTKSPPPAILSACTYPRNSQDSTIIMHISISTTLLLTLVTSAAATAAVHESPRWAPNKYGSGGEGGHHPQPSPPPHYPVCLNDTGVNTLVDGYTYLLEHPGGPDFNATAEAILSNSSFVVESDSILTLSGRPVRKFCEKSKPPFLVVPLCHKFKKTAHDSRRIFCSPPRLLFRLLLSILIQSNFDICVCVHADIVSPPQFPARPTRLPIQSRLHRHTIPNSPLAPRANPRRIRVMRPN